MYGLQQILRATLRALAWSGRKVITNLRETLGRDEAVPAGDRAKPQVFLSHSGLDAARATKLAAELEYLLKVLGHDAEVFNTSEPEHRFKELTEPFATSQYEEELRRYIARNLTSSSAYVLLVTPNSLSARSKWVEYEMESAQSEYELKCVRSAEANLEEGVFYFFPCITGGAGFHSLPKLASRFQAIDLDEAYGVEKLAEAIGRVLSQRV